MGLHGPILAATDLSDGADAALRQAGALAAALGAPLVVCHVLPEAFRVRVLFPHHAGVDAAAQAELHRKAEAAVRLRIAEVVADGPPAIEVAIESGSAHAGILAAAERTGAGLVAVGPGRTAHRVARSSGVPVLVARPSPIGGVVIGATDFSDPALPAVRMAGDEARRRGARLRLLHCLDLEPTAYLAPAGVSGVMALAPLPPAVVEQLEADARGRLDEALRAAGGAGESAVLRMPPSAGIIETARAAATSLVVVGTRGRTGLVRIALGSVAEDVIDHAPCSVLVVPLHPHEG